jgi:hypothetical protein
VSWPVFLGALMGGALGFLWFNAHPAQVFMGDTGSLGIGGAIGTVAILLKAEFLLAIIGGVFVAESLSVLIQTGVFRWYKRTRGREYAEANRVFRMAPLHHHFEKTGLGRDHRGDAVLHPRHPLRDGGTGHAQAALMAETAVIGLGRSGVAATRLLRSRNVAVYASDAGAGDAVTADGRRAGVHRRGG